jgi:uncharacterized glyoxalase superfamily protein PhnB
MSSNDNELDPVAPEFFVPNVDEAIKFYSEKLGFTVQRREPADGDFASFAILRLDEAMVMFMYDAFYSGPRAELDQRGAGLDIRIMVEDVDAMYGRVKAAGMPILHDIGNRDYGLRDFITRDPNGFRLRFASPLE